MEVFLVIVGFLVVYFIIKKLSEKNKDPSQYANLGINDSNTSNSLRDGYQKYYKNNKNDNYTPSLIEKRIMGLIFRNYEYGEKLNRLFYTKINKDNILIVLEVYTFLNILTTHYLDKNNADKEQIDMWATFSWGTIHMADMWRTLKLTDVEIEKFVDDRILNYAKLFVANSWVVDRSILEYQTQLFSEIIKNNKLSYFNPMPENIAFYSPVQLDYITTNSVKLILNEFHLRNVTPLVEGMKNKLTSDYFNRDEDDNKPATRISLEGI